MQERETNPKKVAVQLNSRVPWYLREVLVKAAKDRGISQGELLRTALENELRSELIHERSVSPSTFQ